MAWVWTDLPTDYTDATFTGLRKYVQVQNDDGTISFRDVTEYTNKEKSFFGAKDANQINDGMNQMAQRMSEEIPSAERGIIALTDADWVEEGDYFKQQVAYHSFPTAVQDGDNIDVSAGVSTMKQLMADGVSMLYVENFNGVLTAYSYGGKPSVGITVNGIKWSWPWSKKV